MNSPGRVHHHWRPEKPILFSLLVSVPTNILVAELRLSDLDLLQLWPSQGVFSLNGQKQQQTCFLFLRILNKKWGRDALWKLEKLFDIISSFSSVYSNCELDSNVLLLLSVVVECQCFVCALRGGGSLHPLLSPIIQSLTCEIWSDEVKTADH